MTPEARDQAEAYFAQSRSWASERSDDMRRSRNIAWVVALIAAGVALAEGIAIVMLTPLKTVVPYTLLVDRQTGYVQALDPIAAPAIAPDTALTQSFLVQYVLAREGFDLATVQQDYRKTLLWSAESAKRAYADQMIATNPDSPLTRYPRGTIIDARVRSVSSLGGRTALVRFETVRRDRAGVGQAPQAWVAVIDYRFSSEPLSAEDRFLNPLGFQVTRYRRSAEAVPALIEAPPTQPPSPSAGIAPQQQPAPPSTTQPGRQP